MYEKSYNYINSMNFFSIHEPTNPCIDVVRADGQGGGEGEQGEGRQSAGGGRGQRSHAPQAAHQPTILRHGY